jgi:hypothetical protein
MSLRTSIGVLGAWRASAALVIPLPWPLLLLSLLPGGGVPGGVGVTLPGGGVPGGVGVSALSARFEEPRGRRSEVRRSGADL